MKTIYSIFIILMATLTAFCGPSTGGDDGLAILAALEDGGGCIKAPGNTTTTPNSPSAGINTTIVNATASNCWTYIDLKAGGVETTQSGTWDLKFKRFVIGTNSGTSGSGNAGACFNDSTNLSNVTNNTYCTPIEVDQLMSQTGGGGFGTATENASPALWEWYNYNGTTHELTPKTRGYLIRGSDGTSYFGLEVTDYYDGASTSGFPTFKWKTL